MPHHLLIVRFPAALLCAAAAADVAGVATRRHALRSAAGWLQMAGSAAVVLAFLTGAGAASEVLARFPAKGAVIDGHAQGAAAALWLVALAAVPRVLLRRETSRLRTWASLALCIASAAAVVAVSGAGAAISHAA